MNTLISAKKLLQQEFSEVYDLFRKYGIGQSHIRTRVFNPLKFPRVKISDDHKEACEKYVSLMNENDLRTAIRSIKELLEKYIIYNNKIVQFYDVSAATLRAIDNNIEKQLLSSDPASLAGYYPDFPADSKVISEDILPIKSIKINDELKVFLVGSRREYYKIFQLNKGDLTPSALSMMQDVKEVSAKGMVSELSIDVLVLDYNSSRLELRLSNAVSMSKMNTSNFQKKLIKYVQGILGGKINDPIDFLSKVNDYYFANDLGRVVAFDFLTEEGVERTEKVRNRKDDLKNESYHIGGTEKVNKIFQSHSIAKVWDFKSDDGDHQVSLKVKGSLRLILKAGQTVDQVYLLDCFGESDYNYLLSKLLL
ncbi:MULTISPECIES: hypothetical protein [unclassified Halomonas]|uniref:hypothetical protein n=1 Tax=unclassified Halomonas TaxID=2609666 RepID=UPI00209D3435|nr:MULTISPECIES: hypothetical protein [unclassified Halomonas]MCP1314166.1 hypothetical protein [Halomonas sp. 707D7]MCP1326568.1 hypothetical protein [Halomonas sp. 707D4]